MATLNYDVPWAPIPDRPQYCRKSDGCECPHLPVFLLGDELPFLLEAGSLDTALAMMRDGRTLILRILIEALDAGAQGGQAAALASVVRRTSAMNLYDVQVVVAYLHFMGHGQNIPGPVRLLLAHLTALTYVVWLSALGRMGKLEEEDDDIWEDRIHPFVRWIGQEHGELVINSLRSSRELSAEGAAPDVDAFMDEHRDPDVLWARCVAMTDTEAKHLLAAIMARCTQDVEARRFPFRTLEEVATVIDAIGAGLLVRAGVGEASNAPSSILRQAVEEMIDMLHTVAGTKAQFPRCKAMLDAIPVVETYDPNDFLLDRSGDSWTPATGGRAWPK